MEVTRNNFNEALPLIVESLKKADFLTIDAEFTGLINGRDVSVFDLPAEYYTRVYHGAREFLLVQFGLCAFYYDYKKKQYMNDAYNFYLFPRKPGPDKVFLCQSSSLDFLASQGFDFNKLIKEGISYMTEPIESKLRDQLKERQKTYLQEKDLINIPEQNKEFIEDICKQVRKFIDDNEMEDMEITRCNNFVRRLLFQELGRLFKDEIFLETIILENQSRVIKVTRLRSGDESARRTTQKKEKEWVELNDAVGFSKVARMISQSGKLLIGHNMLLDVIHTLNHFFQPLPEDYRSFKEFTHCIFPRLLDTKYMSSLPPFKEKINSNVLQHLFTSLSEEPFVLPRTGSRAGRGYSHSAEKHHEAGYDAYVTGLCFLAMFAHLNRMRGEFSARVNDPDCPMLKPFLNKLFLARTANQDSAYMNITGADPSPSRDHVFHMTFPVQWVRNDINQLFSPFGPVTIQFLDESSAMVALSRRDQAREVMRTIARNKLVKLEPHAVYERQRKTNKMQAQRSQQQTSKQVLPTETKIRQAHALITGPTLAQTPNKVYRTRSNSVSTVTSPVTAPPARKRTSSGVFQVDESEPLPKKSESRAEVEGLQMKTEPTNGKRKVDVAEGDKEKLKDNSKVKEIAKPVVQIFDSMAKNQTVEAFKESDCWD